MRTETGQQESKPTTPRRARGEGRKQPAARKPAPKAPARKSPARASKAATNKAVNKTANKAQSKAKSKPATTRTSEAEEAVDRMGEQIGRFATLIGREVLKAAARAREEIEDMVAEAQSLRDTIQGPPHAHGD